MAFMKLAVAGRGLSAFATSPLPIRFIASIGRVVQ
jgi:hypothetical protein